MKLNPLKCTIILALFLLASSLFVFSETVTNRFDLLTTLNGQTYKNAELKRQEDNCLVFFHSSGIVKIPIAELSDSVLSAVDLLPTRAKVEQKSKETLAQKPQEPKHRQAKLKEYEAKHFFGKILYTLVCGKDGVVIRTGPGNDYPKDSSGKTLKGETFYVLGEKDGWIKFRVTKKNVGWSGWVPKKAISAKIKKSGLQILYDTGLLKKFNIDNNEARVDPLIWNGLDYNTKVRIAKLLARLCDEAGSTGRITILNNMNGKKLAKHSQAWGFKHY